MSGVSAIEWTDATWNPVTGCTRVSPGCAHCYIERTPPFRMQGRRFATVGGAATTGVRLHPERLEQPLRWTRPRRIFVNSLSDLFHEDVPDEFISRVYRVMLKAQHHTFQVLTKRPERALQWWHERWCGSCDARPSPNVWLGVSIENARYTWRADVLREIPAAVRFISAEPLLGSLYPAPDKAIGRAVGARRGELVARFKDRNHLDLSGIDWLIAGGESGPGARPMHPEWARELRDACLAPFACDRCRQVDPPETPHWAPCERGPAFFFKQWGHFAPWASGERSSGYGYVTLRDGTRMAAMGKKAAGRLLDGHEWDEMPERRS